MRIVTGSLSSHQTRSRRDIIEVGSKAQRMIVVQVTVDRMLMGLAVGTAIKVGLKMMSLLIDVKQSVMWVTCVLLLLVALIDCSKSVQVERLLSHIVVPVLVVAHSGTRIVSVSVACVFLISK